MESSLQKIISAIVGVLVLFIVPIYVAFEKIDDISYSLVLKITQNFVDNATNKGYISPDMYNEFVSGVYATNNSYEITLEHVKKRYDPVIYIYEKLKDNSGNYVIENNAYKKGKVSMILDYEKYIDDYLDGDSALHVGTEIYYFNDAGPWLIETAQAINEEIISDKQIVERIFRGTGLTKLEFLRLCRLGEIDTYISNAYKNENSYVMNKGDKIIVTVKNSNKTMAGVLYNMLTANVGSDDVAKIFVEYGGTVNNDGVINNGYIKTDLGSVYYYTGDVQEVTLEGGNVYEIELWGASGGYPSTTNYFGNPDDLTRRLNYCFGAYIKTHYYVHKDTTIYLYIGGKGTLYSSGNTENGGYNGGGNSYGGYGGGGATDIRLIKGETEKDTASLLTRIMVAGGGGGCSSKSNNGYGGDGGNFGGAGNGKPASSSYEGIGATAGVATISVGYDGVPAVEKGGLLQGGNATVDGAGGGGGGYYGGGASHDPNAGGGGGLSYLWPETEFAFSNNSTVYPLPGLVESTYAAYLNQIEHLKYNTKTAHWKNIINLWDGNSYSWVNPGDVSPEHRDTRAQRGSEQMRDPLDNSFEETVNFQNNGDGYVRIRKIESNQYITFFNNNIGIYPSAAANAKLADEGYKNFNSEAWKNNF